MAAAPTDCILLEHNAQCISAILNYRVGEVAVPMSSDDGRTIGASSWPIPVRDLADARHPHQCTALVLLTLLAASNSILTQRLYKITSYCMVYAVWNKLDTGLGLLVCILDS